MRLRPYQQDCFDSIMGELDTGRSTLAVLATGCGKTIIFGHVAANWQMGRVLVVAHRDELIRQAADKVGRIVGEQCAIEMGQVRSNESRLYDKAHVVVTSVQTMSRPTRHQRFDPNEFGLIIVDEAHHGVSDTYLRILGHFRQNPNLKLLGVTATPDRADEEALGRVFESVAYEYGIREAIHDGWLVPVQQQLIQVHGLDFSRCRTTAGDLNQGDLASIMEAEKMLHAVVDPTMEIAGDRRTLIFTTSVAHAERACEIANRHRPYSAEWIHGGTPIDVRREILRRYSRGDFQFLFNCAIALEGFDEPGIQVVAMARPTKSRALYAQAIGRGTRPLTGTVDGIETAADRINAIATSDKPNVLVLDFVGNSGNHKLVHATDVLGVDYSDAELEAALAEIAERSAENKPTDIEEAFALAAERRERLKHAKEIEEQARQKYLEEQALREASAAKRQGIVAKANYSQREIDPFDVFDIHRKQERGWDKGRRPTPKMLDVLRKGQIPEAQLERMTLSEAKQLLPKVIERWQKNLCSLKQANILRRYGYPADTTRTDAKRIIDEIAANGWRRAEKPAPVDVNALLNQEYQGTV